MGVLWFYLIILKILDFTSSRNLMEKQLPNRPARRTIGRVNDDVIKSIMSILLSYFLIFAVFYLGDYLGSIIYGTVLNAIGVAFVIMSLYLMSPANRRLNAYCNTGHIAVIHFICALSVALPVLSLSQSGFINIMHYGYLSVTVAGVMLFFFKKPSIGVVHRKTASGQSGDQTELEEG